MSEQMVRIWSGEHLAFWRPNANGYSTSICGAGIFTESDAIERTKHCGPEKKITLKPVDDSLNEYEAKRSTDMAIILKMPGTEYILTAPEALKIVRALVATIPDCDECEYPKCECKCEEPK